MSLAEKYCIPHETIKMMVRDGVISTSWAGYEEIYTHYQKVKTVTISKTEAVHIVAEEKKVCETRVFKSISKFER